LLCETVGPVNESEGALMTPARSSSAPLLMLTALALACALVGGCGKAPHSMTGPAQDAACPDCMSLDAGVPGAPDLAPVAAPDLGCTTCSDGRIPLRDNWQLQSSAQVSGSGADI